MVGSRKKKIVNAGHRHGYANVNLHNHLIHSMHVVDQLMWSKRTNKSHLKLCHCLEEHATHRSRIRRVILASSRCRKHRHRVQSDGELSVILGWFDTIQSEGFRHGKLDARELVQLIGIRCLEEQPNTHIRVGGTRRWKPSPLTANSSCALDCWLASYFVHEPQPAAGVVRAIYRAAPALCQTLYRIFDSEPVSHALSNITNLGIHC